MVRSLFDILFVIKKKMNQIQSDSRLFNVNVLDHITPQYIFDWCDRLRNLIMVLIILVFMSAWVVYMFILPEFVLKSAFDFYIKWFTNYKYMTYHRYSVMFTFGVFMNIIVWDWLLNKCIQSLKTTLKIAIYETRPDLIHDEEITRTTNVSHKKLNNIILTMCICTIVFIESCIGFLWEFKKIKFLF